MPRRCHHVCLILALLISVPPASAADNTGEAVNGPSDFARDVAPILQQHCVRCHTPGNEKGDLSLATADDLQENGFVVAGDPDASYLVELITSAVDQRPAMPKEAEPLSPAQVATIRRWIADGAQWPAGLQLHEASKADASWWSLQPLATTAPPPDRDVPGDWTQNPIDRWVFAKLAENGLAPNAPADRRTLIRRATYDLIGLPPTPEEVAAFAGDDDPQAYERLIDRLLASPQYGQRWARHWLDVVRFGESNGFERNVIIDDLWPFRDYVIASLNEDKPFDQFIREHLAGDVFGAGQPAVEIGTAFLVAGPYDDVGNQDAVQAAQIRANTIDEMIRATSEAFLGLTVGCARCHDHKFDPILQRDYYSLYATFAAVRHGSRVLATDQQRAAHAARLQPLQSRRNALVQQRDAVRAAVTQRVQQRAAEYEKRWQREPVDRQGTEERFAAVQTQYVRLVSEGQDVNPENTSSFGIDELEAWSAEPSPRNVALAANGGVASGPSRTIKDFPGAYGPQLAIDGQTGRRFLAVGGQLTIQFARPTRIDRVSFSSARGETTPEHNKFAFVGEYRIEVSEDGRNWTEVANSHDRRPVSEKHRAKRLWDLEVAAEERALLAEIDQQLAALDGQIAAVPPLPTAWIGSRVAEDAAGPFHVFLGGSPQQLGDAVVPASLSVLKDAAAEYALQPDAAESTRRQALADWIVHRQNPLTPRVSANRLWHYHFGTGIVDTPSDFGYMGGRPTHPELLDWLAVQLHQHDWRLKPMHKLIMMSQTYRQSARFRPEAAKIDGDARLLWRFPPRRLSAEELRDTLLIISGKLDASMGGPGFRLYEFMQDNVCTYVPLDQHGPETFRRAIYHQNARASVVDLMTDFDQPDCAFATPRRAETTTPLQALTMLNHSFTTDMAACLADRLQREAGQDPRDQILRAYELCYARQPSDEETAACTELVQSHGLAALCRVLWNTSELIHVQ